MKKQKTVLVSYFISVNYNTSDQIVLPGWSSHGIQCFLVVIKRLEEVCSLYDQLSIEITAILTIIIHIFKEISKQILITKLPTLVLNSIRMQQIDKCVA